MADWARSEILSLITLPFWAIGTFATAATVRWALLRRMLMMGVVLTVVMDGGAVVWLIQRDQKAVVPKTPIDLRPVSKQETPSPTPPVEPRDFQVVPENPEAIKNQYCLLADFKGSLVPNAGAIDVTITEANLDLCRFSRHGSRRIAIRVGVALNSSTRGRGGVAWSSRTTVVAQLTPGESFALSAPVRLSIPKRTRDLSRAVVVIEVENRPADSGWPSRYLLHSGTDYVASN
jgi:hypothetical protein